MPNEEFYISVDVETSGPIPGEFSLLQIGACEIGKAKNQFECLVKPISQNAVQAALGVTGLSMRALERDGIEPPSAMKNFGDWIRQSAGSKRTPVFVGLNAAFDWSFINYYFHRYTGENPFGHAALDIKSLYMGMAGCKWQDCSARDMSTALHAKLTGDHDALHDALFQAEIFSLILTKLNGR